MKNECPCAPIEIPSDREIVDCNNLTFNWKQDPKGYFLVKIENSQICCGFCTTDHKMILELRSTDPEKIIKEIVKRDLCDKDNLAYIAQELMIAYNSIINDTEYVQR
tara:strand:- start:32 stop:352 length:321 start_codon:yes stop_codon:yes gene_type:complete